jgi:hypothetical protein
MDKTKDQLDNLSFEEFEEYRVLCVKYAPNWDGRFKNS